ncbi:MAG: hemerythrin family protein [Leptospiraceae bacterium]|nr:hemerythrin family protein [Leptospiraceae bacterium]
MQALDALPIDLNSVVVERVSALWQHAGLALDLNVIDAQHAWLVALVLELEWTLIHEPTEIPDRFRVILHEAGEYANEHFSVEEQLMHAFNYNEETKHIKSHRKFVQILGQLAGGEQITSREDGERLYRYLRKWLIQHILVEDRKYAEYFRRRKLVQDANSRLDSIIKEGRYHLHGQQQFLRLIGRRGSQIDVSTPELLKEIGSMWNRLNLATGIPIIDIQHLWLIKMIVDVDEAMRESSMTRSAVLHRTLSEASLYVELHFRTEERLMDLLQYSDSEEHRKRHHAFEEFVAARKGDFESGNMRAAITIVNDLREWLSSHIAFEDKKFVSLYKQNRDAVLEFSKDEITSDRAGISQPQVNLYRNIVQKQDKPAAI